VGGLVLGDRCTSSGLVDRALSSLFARLGIRYLIAFLAFELGSALVLALCALALIAIYHPISAASFGLTYAITALFVTLAFAWGTYRLGATVDPLLGWLRDRRPQRAEEAWRCAAGLPLAFVRNGAARALLAVAPLVAFVVSELALPLWWLPILGAVAALGVGYSLILDFFASELALRPVLIAIESQLSAPPPTKGVSLRWRLLVALPAINLITGALTAGVAHAGPRPLAGAIPILIAAIAAGLAATLILTVLVIDSLLHPIGELTSATRRVKEGDLAARARVVPVGELSQLGESFNQMLGALAERITLREALASYVHPEVARRVLQEGARIEGQEAEATILFIDIRGFSAYSERARPGEIVALVNRFLAVVTPALAEYGGHANKIIGDAVLGVVGIPERHHDHADRALAAAHTIAARATTEGIAVGIGINSGRVVAGTIGEGERLDFTVLGDAVNVAARVQELTRQTGDTILITESTLRSLGATPSAIRPRRRVPVRGKTATETLYGIPAGRQQLPSLTG